MAHIVQKLCFVIGPIGRHKSEDRVHADTLLKKIIKPTFASHFKAFRVERADHIARPGMIDSQVISRLIEADLVVADLTNRNANAFYELGIRHMLQKPVIHMYRRGDVIPADIAPYRAIEFAYHDKWDIRDAKVALRKTVSEVILPHFYTDNPVTRSDGFIRMQNAKTTPQLKRAKPSPSKPKKLFSPPPALILTNSPGVIWVKEKDEFTACWMAPRKAVKHGFRPKGLKIWSGKEGDLSHIARNFISDRANALQNEVAAWESVIR